MSRRGLIGLVAFVTAFLGVAPASADTVLPPVIDHDMTWTEAGSPYLALGWTTINSGVTVTAEPGVLVKGNYDSGYRFDVYGTLNLQGSAEKKVTFTSRQDSAPRQWGGIDFKAGSSGSIDHAELRYGGKDIEMLRTAAPIQVTNSTFRSSYTSALRVTSGSAQISSSTFTGNYRGILVDVPADPLVSGNTVERSTVEGVLYSGSPFGMGGQIHVTGNTVRDNAGDGFVMSTSPYGYLGGEVRGNTFEGNAANALKFRGTGLPTNNPLPQQINQNTATGNGCDCASLSDVGITQPTTWEPGLTFVLARGLEVASTLALQGGVVVKGSGGNVSRVQVTTGSFDVSGSKANPVVFTSFADDSFGGDTNKDGWATQPAPRDWGGITISGQARLSGAFLAFGGAQACTYCYEDTAMLSLPAARWGSAVAITDSRFHYSGGDAIDVWGDSGALPTIEQNTFSGNGPYAVYKSGSTIQPAPNNRWGCASGPKPYGCGDAINNKVQAPPFGDEVDAGSQ